MKLIDQYIDQMLLSTPEKPLWNQEMIRQNKTGSWNYIDGCMMTAFLRLYGKTGEERYLQFVKEFIDYFVTPGGRIATYDPEEYNLDNINEGRCLFFLYDRYGDPRYKTALDLLYLQLQKQPRTDEGSFWHKKIYPHQVWLDGLYMAQPFYLEYEKRFNRKRGYPDILNQFRVVRKRLRDQNTGLYYHAYDASRTMFWCDPLSGCSRHFWLRALGWFSMALVDVLELLDPEDEALRDELRGMFEDLVQAVLPWQDEGGMWFQIIDRKDQFPNYPETSGTAILSYAILKAVDLGLLPESFTQYGGAAFQGITNTYLFEKEGRMNLGGTCLVAGLGGPQKRDGSFEYYMSEPVVENEAKGIAPFLLAYLYY